MAINGNYKDSTSLKSIVLSLLSMSSAHPAHRFLSTLVWPFLSGFLIYVVLSSLTIPFRITVPLSFSISIIIFGLFAYYGKERETLQYTNNRSQAGSNKSILNFFFVAIYITSIIFAFLVQDNLQIFVSWQKITILQIVMLGCAIGISIFMPGYGLINILEGKPKLGNLPKFLLSYIFSILITALAAYITASVGLTFSNFNSILGSINLVILCLFIYIKILDRGSPIAFDHIYFPKLSLFAQSLKTKMPELLVFTGLFIFVVISTYYLYNGTIIGDQWFHHGRAVQFLRDAYRDYSLSGINEPYPSLFPAFLAGFFDMSGMPTANAYVSINFLNFMPIPAFYYFFVKWIPTKKKAALLATTLFALSSGFGWIYVLNLAVHDYTGLSTSAVMEIFHTASIKTYDISVPNSFINVGHPDITSSLVIISLPAGFVLLGLLREKISSFRFVYFFAAIILVYLFHQEFGLFVIVAVVLYVIYRCDGGNRFFMGALIGFSVILLVALFSPDEFYRTHQLNIIQGLAIPVFAIYFLLIPFGWAFYSSNILYKIHLPRSLSNLVSKKINTSLGRFILGVTAISVVSYLYILSFIVWDNQLSFFDMRIHTREFSVVPWHFYPLKLGIIGLVGLAYLLSYTFKRFEKEVFVFGIFAIVAFLTGYFYDEQRVNKYIMTAMVGFASLLIYEILLMVNQSRKQILGGLIISIFVVSSSFSIVLYISYVALALEHPTQQFNEMLPRRFFPSNSEFSLLNFLSANMNPRLDNIALPEQNLVDTGGIYSQLQYFAGIPSTRLLMSPSTLQEPTLEGLYTLLDYPNTRFIVLQKDYIYNNGLSEVLKFTLDNFERVYEDKNYVVLSVPQLSLPSEDGETALISPKSLNNYSMPILVTNTTLDYGKDFTRSLNRSLEKDGTVTLSGEDKNTYWSNVTQDNINYIEGKFRVSGDSKTENHGGIAWAYGDKVYHAFMKPDRGMFITTPTGKELTSQSLGNADQEWNTIKVVDVMDGEINIYLNDVLQVSVYKPFPNASISEVGINSVDSIAQFDPIVIGQTQRPIPILVTDTTLDYGKDFTRSLNRSLEKDGTVTLSGEDKNTYWSNVTQDNINYIEGKFRVSGDSKTDNHGGIAWAYGDKVYHAFIRPDRGMFIATPTGKELTSPSWGNATQEWNTIKVVDVMDGKINIYLNDVLQVSVYKPFSNASISNVGINSVDSIAQFDPIVIGQTQRPDPKSDMIHHQYGYYYSLTALALSKLKYDSFVEGDFSALSKKNIILPFDPVDARTYLDLANKGKTIIVLNTDEDFKGGFSNFLCIQPQKDKERVYDSIENSVGRTIKVSGTAGDIKINCPAIVKSFYMKGGQESVPFEIVKEYGNGKIIFANLHPYFASISKDPKRHLSTLKDIIPALDLKLIDNKYVNDTDTTLNAIPSTRFVGDLSLSGQVKINSSSLLLPTDDFYAETISIWKQNEKDNHLLLPSSSISNKTNFNKLHIRDLKIYGAYDASVSSDKLSYLPSQSKSFSVPYGYFEFELPSRSSMTINLAGNQSSAEFFLGEDKIPIKITDGLIEFKGINRNHLLSSNNSNLNQSGNDSDSSYTNLPVLMKRPEIKSVNGSISFQELHSNNPYSPTIPWMSKVPLQINGETTILRLNHVAKDPDSITRRMTYFDWIEVHLNADERTKYQIGSLLEIEWDKLLTSGTNAILALSVIVFTLLTIYVIWSNPYLKRRLIEHKRSPA